MADPYLLQSLQTQINDARVCGANIKHVDVDYDNYTITVLDGADPIKYVPNKTALDFHRDNTRIRVTRGHVGSGKTVSMCAEIVFRACRMPPCRDGVRRSRWALIRNTYGDLEKTTIKTWNSWFRNLGIRKSKQSPAYIITHTFNDGNGIVELELFPIGLDTVVDVTKHLKSLEVTGVFLNELSELHKLVLDFFTGGRLPRYPRKIDFSQEIQEREQMYWSGLFADTNPPEEDSWIYNTFEVEKPQGYRMFVQPPAVLKTETGYIINPEAENIKHIPNGEVEYINMTQGKDDNFIRIYLMGEYGTLTTERRVFNNYNDNIHSMLDMPIDHKAPLIFGCDLGTVAPTVLMAQFVSGQLRVIKEFCGQFMTMKELVESSVVPFLRMYCSDMRIVTVQHDPADTYDGAAQLREFFGEVVQPSSTNSVEPRINAVSTLLNKLVAGKGLLCISQDGCPQLRKGFNGKYFYRRLRLIGEERYQEFPHKNHPFSDIQDCMIAGTMVTMFDNTQIAIENIKPGMFVLTPNGARKVTKAWLARKDAIVHEYIFSDGSRIVATPEHKILSNGKWCSIDDIGYNDIVLSINNKSKLLCVKTILKSFANIVKNSLKSLHVGQDVGKETIVQKSVENTVVVNEKELKLMGSGSLKTMENTSNIEVVTIPQSACTDIYGKNITEKFPHQCVCTTKTKIYGTIVSKILNSYRDQSTLECTQGKDARSIQRRLVEQLKRLKNGTELRRVWNGILNEVRKFGKRCKGKNLNVQYVENCTHLFTTEKDTVQNIVSKKRGICQGLIMKLGYVWFAIKNLLLISIGKQKLVEVRLVSKRLYPDLKDVYDITVEDEHCFFANGILVHNCLQYICLWVIKELLFIEEKNLYGETRQQVARETSSRITGY